MWCNFQIWKDSLFKCTECGYITKYGQAQRECIYVHQPQYEPDGPSLIRRIINFSKAAVQHELTGRKIVSDEVLKARLSICTNCPSNLFKRIDAHSGFCAHESCGCNIKDHQTYLNKIAWAEQFCPMNHWGPSSGTKEVN